MTESRADTRPSASISRSSSYTAKNPAVYHEPYFKLVRETQAAPSMAFD